jgi:hypothetical protein
MSYAESELSHLVHARKIQVRQVHVAFENDMNRKNMRALREGESCEIFRVVPMVPLSPRDRIPGIIGRIDFDQAANIFAVQI